MQVKHHIYKLLFVLSTLSFASMSLASPDEFLYEYGESSTTQIASQNSDSYLLLTQSFSQNTKRNLRSRSDVVREVKQRYNAEVLRIKLSSSGTQYEVRVLMPNGKVKNIRVSAMR